MSNNVVSIIQFNKQLHRLSDYINAYGIIHQRPNHTRDIPNVKALNWWLSFIFEKSEIYFHTRQDFMKLIDKDLGDFAKKYCALHYLKQL